MSTYTEGDRVTKQSAADLSEKRYYIVKTNSDDKVVLASAATDAILGVLDDGGRVLGDSCDVVLINGQGTFKVKLGDNVAKDAYLTADAEGKAVATTTANDRVFGRAAYAGSDGDIIEYYKMNEKVSAA